MDSSRPSPIPPAARLAAAWRGAANRIRPLAALGIASRLSIAFAAVTVLAIAANSIAERGAAIISSIENVPATAPAIAAQPGSDALPVALEQFQVAVLARIEADGPVEARAHRAAVAALGSAGAEFARASADSVDDAGSGELTGQIEAHLRLAAGLLQETSARRSLHQDYAARFASLDARMKASLDRTWKIFGKLIAREYLVEASRITDELRGHNARLAAPDGYGPDTLEAIRSGEETLTATLGANERGVVRALGSDWLETTREDLAAIAGMRAALVAADGRRAAGLAEFRRSHAALAATVRRHAAADQTSRAVAAARRQSADAIATIAAEEHRQRSLLAWLTGGVLVLILAISVSTVVSVLLPVRRLMQATRRLAQGNAGVSVPRGGLRELDELAVSFNHMAEQLAAAQALARQYHGQLEARVEERTRQLQHMAEHDPLTRLPNRRQLFVQLDAALERAAAAKERVGVFFLDLDHFKNVNDSMGHVFGDRVLQTVAERLRSAAAASGFCARLGGDEFTVVHERATSAREIELAGRALVRAFQDPLVVDGRELLMGLSVGASIYPDHARDAEGLLGAADAALFRAKAQGRSQLGMFSPDLLAAAASRFATEQGLRRAVDRGEFELYFQPEVNLETLETGLAEALLRWRLPNGNYVSPQDFLQVAEDCGLISEIGAWVLRSAVEHAARWHRDGWPGVRIAVNVSARELLDNQFAGNLADLLERHRVPAACIEVELTENVLQTGPRTVEALRQLRAVGVGVALDDFGSGYSSLASLEQLPLTRVKLDRSLIASIDTSARSQAIARAILALCDSLGLAITAEGIERREQLAWLRGHSSMFLQGHLLSPPVPADALLPAIAEMPARVSALLDEPARPATEGRPRLRRVR